MNDAIKHAEAFVRQAEATQTINEQLASGTLWVQQGGLSNLVISGIWQHVRWHRLEKSISENVNVLEHVQGGPFIEDKVGFARAIADIPRQGE